MNTTQLRYAAALSLLLFATLSHADELPGLKGHKRVVFLGDSITYSGQYIDVLGAYLAVKYPQQKCELINLGLPSETVSGLSEPGHAGGAFPRPDVHERLGRVLEKVKPDLVVACYGMNCGMYYPLSKERMEKFQSGILRLREAAEKAGAKVIHITPPVFDSEPIKARTLPAGRAWRRRSHERQRPLASRPAIATRAAGPGRRNQKGQIRRRAAEGLSAWIGSPQADGAEKSHSPRCLALRGRPQATRNRSRHAGGRSGEESGGIGRKDQDGCSGKMTDRKSRTRAATNAVAWTGPCCWNAA
ncbi:MAG: hypothetical protein K8R36_17275 [Planctomycetales bacterium]|nr:hypothetical protein [Planctomycetales bacterium]